VISEAKVGLTAVAVVALLVMGTIFLSGSSLLRGGKEVVLHFRNVEGLADGAVVSFIGVTVGRVTSIELATPEDLKAFPERPVVVHLRIDREAPVFDTDEFTVSQAGLLGETHVAVIRRTQAEREDEARLLGTTVKASVVVSDKQHLAGERVVGMAELGDEARVVLQQVKSAVSSFQSVYAGPDIQRRLPAILGNVEAATRHAVEFSQALARLSLANEGRISQTAANIASMAGELNRTAARVERMVQHSAPDVEASTSRVAALIQTSAKSVEATSQHLERTGARVERLVETSAGDIEVSTRVARATMEQTSGSLGRMTATLEETTRTASDDLLATTKRVRELIAGSSGNIESAAAAVERTTRSMAALVEETSTDLSASTKRVGDLVRKGAADVEETSTNLAAMSVQLRTDLASAGGDLRTTFASSGADLQRTTGRLAQMTDRSAADIEAITQRVNEMLTSSPLPADLADAGSHIRQAAENLSVITSDVRGTLAAPEFQQQIRTVAANLATTSENLVAISEESRLLVADGRGFLGSSRAALESISSQVGDEAMWGDMRGTVAQLRKAMDDLAAITAHGREVFADPALTEDLKASLGNVRRVSEKGVQIADQASASLARVDQTMERVTGVTSQLKPSRTLGWASLQAGDGTGLRADANADLFFSGSDDFWRVGVFDLGDGERLNLQRGLAVGGGAALRLGIYANKLGVGYDYLPGGGLGLEADLWDPNAPRLDARALWRLGPAWQVFVGADNIFSQTQPFVGIRSNLPFAQDRKAGASGAGQPARRGADATQSAGSPASTPK
jgi:ABC-type transporter Mla subunit MlaD